LLTIGGSGRRQRFAVQRSAVNGRRVGGSGRRQRSAANGRVAVGGSSPARSAQRSNTRESETTSLVTFAARDRRIDVLAEQRLGAEQRQASALGG
jgi:hypothetical protein